MAVTSNLQPNNKAVDPTLTVRFSWAHSVSQTHYQLIYRRVGSTTWVDTGRVKSTNKYRDITANTLLKNVNYEWRLRIWYGTSETQDEWSSTYTFRSEIPASTLIKGVGTGLRVVPLGKSNQTSNIRINLGGTKGVSEFDLVTTGADADSGVRVQVNSNTTRAIAKALSNIYSNYGNHSNTGYLRYNNHSDYGYWKYDDHSNSGYKKYPNASGYGVKYYDTEYPEHTNTGYDKYGNYGKFYADGGNYYKYYNVYYNATFQNYTKSYFKEAYYVYSKTGYDAYSNHTNDGYSAYNNFEESGYGAYSNHSNTQ